MITHTYPLDVVPGNQQATFKLSQYDENFTMVLQLYAREGTLTLENGTTVELQGTKPDGDSYTKAASLSGNNVTIVGDGNLTDVAGTGTFELCMTHNSKVLHTANFSIYIEPSPMERGE